jgi:hypothetical protein
LIWLRRGTSCGNEPLGSIKSREFLTSWGNIRFSRRTLLCGVGWLFVVKKTCVVWRR